MDPSGGARSRNWQQIGVMRCTGCASMACPRGRNRYFTRMAPDDLDYLRKREADERAAADDASCMARTAHEDLADEYADRAAELAQQAAEREAGLQDLLDRID